jgi:hypothetical protein
MSIGLKEHVSDLAGKVAGLYRELVTNTVKFDELRLYTKETLDGYKHALERMSDKFEAAERERIRVETELRSKVSALEARLDALSEKALHAAARDAAVEVMGRLMSEGRDSLQNPASETSSRKSLGSGSKDGADSGSG